MPSSDTHKLVEALTPDCESFDLLRCPRHPDQKGELVCSECFRAVCLKCISLSAGACLCVDCESKLAKQHGLPGRLVAALWSPAGAVVVILVATTLLFLAAQVHPDRVGPLPQTAISSDRDVFRWLAKAQRLRDRAAQLEEKSRPEDARAATESLLAVFDFILRKFPESPHRGRFLLAQGMTFEKLGEKDKALQSCRQAQHEPKIGEFLCFAHYLGGMLVSQKGNRKEAISELEEAVKGLERFASVRAEKALAATQLAWKAEETLAQATGTDINRDNLLMQAYFRLAECWESEGALDAARRWLDALLARYDGVGFGDSIWVAKARSKLKKLTADKSGTSSDGTQGPDGIKVKPLDDH